MRFKCEVIEESGYSSALLGLSLNKNQDINKMSIVAEKLSGLDGGHNKFLESIQVWLDITAPRYWWQEFDTYRVGITKQSQSTMHTIMKGRLSQDNFVCDIPDIIIDILNDTMYEDDFVLLKAILPEGFLQRRVVCTNYKSLRHINKQRHNHRLLEWQQFCDDLELKLEYPKWLTI